MLDYKGLTGGLPTENAGVVSEMNRMPKPQEPLNTVAPRVNEFSAAPFKMAARKSKQTINNTIQ